MTDFSFPSRVRRWDIFELSCPGREYMAVRIRRKKNHG
jgi:hypothetical protein